MDGTKEKSHWSHSKSSVKVGDEGPKYRDGNDGKVVKVGVESGRSRE